MYLKTINLLAAIGIFINIGLFFVLNRFTHHAGETVILVMPFVLGSILYLGWPDVRQMPCWKYIIYPVAITPIVTGAVVMMAFVVRGRVLWVEVIWAIYFLTAWRMAWAVWARTVGVLGERYRRWGRMTRRRAGGIFQIKDSKRRRYSSLVLIISPARFFLVVCLFAPLAIGSLVHRIKIGNPSNLCFLASSLIEPVEFETNDNLTLSGWFLPDGNSNSTVVICHGAGANKGNFVDYLSVFHERGYNSLIFDFRGHGDSDGHTSTFGLLEAADVRAAVAWLKDKRTAQARHVFGLGSSMGAMALIRAASEDSRIEAVVLDSAFVSAPLLMEQHVGRLPIIGPILGNMVLASMSLHAGQSLWELDASEAISKLSPRPLLLIHSENDVVIPPINMNMLYDLAEPPKSRWLAPGEHSNIMTADFDEYRKRVITFFDSAKVNLVKD